MADAVGILAGLAMGLGCWLLAAARRGGAPSRRGLHASIVLAVLSLVLLVGGEGTSTLAVVWPPGSTPTSLTISRTSAFLIIASFWALVLCRPPASDRSPPAAVDRYWPGLAHVTCGLVVVALSLDQFLLRYVVLELVALGVVAALALGSLGTPARTAPSGSRTSLWRHYLVLRCGDVALLGAILLMDRLAGSLSIDAMVAAAAAVPATPRTLVALGTLAAAWIKLGLPGAGGWMTATTCLGARPAAWISSASLPVLGIYLLHRMAPVLHAVGGGPGLAAVGGGLALLVVYRAAVGRTPWSLAALQAHGALGLALVGTGGWYGYLYSFVPVRVCLSLLGGLATRLASGGVRLHEVAVASPEGTAIGQAWATRLLAPISLTAREAVREAPSAAQEAVPAPERDAPGGLLGRISGVLATVADRSAAAAGEMASTLGTRALAMLIAAEGAIDALTGTWAARAASAVARLLHDRVDLALDAASSRLGRTAHGLAGAVQRHHVGRLRRNLLWAVLPALAFIVLAVLGQLAEGV